MTQAEYYQEFNQIIELAKQDCLEEEGRVIGEQELIIIRQALLGMCEEHRQIIESGKFKTETYV